MKPAATRRGEGSKNLADSCDVIYRYMTPQAADRTHAASGASTSKTGSSKSIHFDRAAWAARAVVRVPNKRRYVYYILEP